MSLVSHTGKHTVRNLHFLSKNSTLISRENCRFFWVKNSWKCCGFWLFSCWQLWFHEKNCQKKFDWKTRENVGSHFHNFFFQYAEADGLRILAFPCNQFGSQEPGTNEEIKAFAAAKGVEFDKGFDFFAKIDVNGKNAHPLWDYLKKKQGGTLTDAIKWNFSKFVIDKEGQPVARFSPMDDPIPKVEEAIKKLLWKYHEVLGKKSKMMFWFAKPKLGEIRIDVKRFFLSIVIYNKIF